MVDSITATVAELNYVDGVTSAIQTQLDAKQGADADLTDLADGTLSASKVENAITSAGTDGQVWTSDGEGAGVWEAVPGATLTGLSVTATAAELNTLDGITSTAAELNLLDGSTAGTVVASKGVVVDSDKDITGFRNITLTGELDAATLDVSGNIDVDGVTNLDNTDIDGSLTVDGAVDINATTFDIDASDDIDIDTSDTTGGIAIGTATSGVPISIGHTTSETTVNDNMTVTGNLTVAGTTTTVNSTTVSICLLYTSPSPRDRG